MKRDVRAALEAIAAGKPSKEAERLALDPVVVKKHQRDFLAWDRFATPLDGEPLAAPAEILAPLP